MRCLVGLCLFALAMPVFASDPANPDPALEPPTSWKGRPSGELIAGWGKPKKTKPHGEGGKVLVYRLHFFGDEMVGDTIIRWGEAGCETDVYNSATPRVIATQKVKFYLNREGVIRGEEFAPVKWKRKR